MECVISGENVRVGDCENCLTNRTASQICFKRGFIWGVHDDKDPRWEYSLDEAPTIDVSLYYDKKWIGNNHLLANKPIMPGRKQIIPPEIRWFVWERDNFTCKMCGSRRNLSIDHIYPESKGGLLEKENLQTLCKSCNSRKGAKESC